MTRRSPVDESAADDARALIHEAVSLACGDAERALEIVAMAVSDARVRDFPAEPSEMAAFAKDSLATRLIEELGELVATGVIDQILLGLQRSRPPSVPDLAAIPHVCMSFADLRKVPLDHRAGFVLSLVDGAATMGDIVDASALRADEALHLLAVLEAAGTIRVT